MSQIFTNYSLSMDILSVDFVRPWDYLTPIFNMRDVYVAAYKKGSLSNGLHYG